MSPDQAKAYEYYKKNSTSVEVVKDDVLQKVNFRVKNKVYANIVNCLNLLLNVVVNRLPV